MTHDERTDGYDELASLRSLADAHARIAARELHDGNLESAKRYAALMVEAETKANVLRDKLGIGRHYTRDES